jgi:hypothetical protein
MPRNGTWSSRSPTSATGYDHLLWLAAQQPLVYQDDTSARVLSLLKDNQAEPAPARQAIYTSVLRCVGEQTICLFFTGRQHAGEHLDDLLALRDAALAPMFYAARGISEIMPRPWICRVTCRKRCRFGRISDAWWTWSRHNQSAFRKARRLSSGWNRVGGLPAGSL